MGMKMKKTFQKLAAVILVMAMVCTGVSLDTIQVSAASNSVGVVKVENNWNTTQETVGQNNEISACVPTLEPIDEFDDTIEVSFNQNNARLSEGGSAKKTHLVYTVEELKQMRNFPNDTFVLMDDVEIGNDLGTIEKFCGILDGNHHKLINVNRTMFFELSNESVIKDIDIEVNLEITNDNCSGCVICINSYATIENCVIRGRIKQDCGTGVDISGMVNLNYGVIKNCRSDVDISQNVDCNRFTCVAGVACSNYGTISDCENFGNIKSGSEFTGGVVGGYFFQMQEGNNGLIIRCKNIGNLESHYKSGAIGGIIADNISMVYQCENEGEISADDGTICGGICGESSRYSCIIGCTNRGKLKMGICGKASILAGIFDEKDNFVVLEGNIIIADCQNIITEIPDNELESFFVCGTASTKNGEIRLTRCENILNEQSNENYCRYVGEDDNGKVIVIEGDRILETKREDAILVSLYENKDLGLNSESISCIYIDNPYLGYMENDGRYITESPGEGIAYCVYRDGTISLRKIVVRPITVETTTPTMPPIVLKSATITAKDVTKTYGNKPFDIKAKVNSKGKLTYSSSDKKVATVSNTGKVTLKGCGRTTITIKATANGAYKSAKKTITLTVYPKSVSLSSAKFTTSKSVTVKWKKDVKATGYILQYCTDKNFKQNVKSLTIPKSTVTSKKISKLLPRKKYYIRICAYKKVLGGKIMGEYSKKKTVIAK